MQWLFTAIAAVFAIGNLAAYVRRRQLGNLVRGLAWVGFTLFLLTRIPWLLYVALAIFIAGLFIRPTASPLQPTDPEGHQGPE